MPIPIKGDITTDPDEILYEPNMTAREDATEFCESTKQNENLKITFDTAHTKSAQEVLNRIRKNGLTTKKDLKRTPFRGIYLEQTRQQPDIYHFLEEFLRREKIADVQLSDVGRLWKPYCHTLSEGAVLGDGLIGDEVFDIAQNSMKYPDIPISIDVSEEDYINRPNQLKSLRRLLERLK
jgi:hypothetical protein